MRYCLMVLLFCSNFLFAETALKVKGSYFYSTSEIFRDVYDNGIFFDLEWDWRFCNRLSAAYDFGYLYKNGKSLNGDQKTSIRIIPLSFLFDYRIYQRTQWFVALGTGPIWESVLIKNSSNYVNPKVSKNGFGGIFRATSDVNLSNKMLFTAFANYIYNRINKPQPINSTVQASVIDLSGFQFGGGVGWHF